MIVIIIIRIIIIIIIIVITITAGGAGGDAGVCQDSSKGGAVEAGCSDLYDIILPPSTAPPSDCTPLYGQFSH